MTEQSQIHARTTGGGESTSHFNRCHGLLIETGQYNVCMLFVKSLFFIQPVVCMGHSLAAIVSQIRLDDSKRY